jgi:Lrp/AsnC family transcriptional regulator, leucine-responsive regulatory protein
MSLSLDRLDLRILAALQVNNQASAQELAAAIPLSRSAILRRIRQYREAGLISADVSILDPAALGERLSVLYMVQLDSHAPAAVSAFREDLCRAPEVQVCMEISGIYDISCIAVFRGMAEFNHFSDHVIAAHPTVRRYEASFVKKRIKFTTAIPLSCAELQSRSVTS